RTNPTRPAQTRGRYVHWSAARCRGVAILRSHGPRRVVLTRLSCFAQYRNHPPQSPPPGHSRQPAGVLPGSIATGGPERDGECMGQLRGIYAVTGWSLPSRSLRRSIAFYDDDMVRHAILLTVMMLGVTAATAQVPQPFPRPGAQPAQPAPPPRPSPPPASTPAAPAEPRQAPSGESSAPTETTLGFP